METGAGSGWLAGLGGIGDGSLETAGAIGGDCFAVGPAAVLCPLDCIRVGAAPRPHVVAVCGLQPALRTPVAADVRSFGWECWLLPRCSSRWQRHTGKIAAGDVGTNRSQLCRRCGRSDRSACRRRRGTGNIRHTLNAAVQRVVEGLPRNSMFLMDLGEHVGVMEQAGHSVCGRS